MKLFTKKHKKQEANTSEEKKMPWYKKIGVKLSIVAVVVASVLIPTTEAVFAEQITKHYMYYYVDVDGYSHVDEPMFTWNGTPTYCIQPSAHMPGPLGGGTGSSVTTGDVFSKTSLDSYGGLTSDLKKKINAISYYGYGYTGRGSADYYFAAQSLIWELCGAPSYWYDKQATIDACRNEIMNSVNKYLNYTSESPNFRMTDNQTGQTVSEGSSIDFSKATIGKTYTITDTKGILGNFTVTQNDFGNRAVVSGNKITVTIDESDYLVQRTISFKRNLEADIDRGESVIIYSSAYQNQFVVGNLVGSGTSTTVKLTGSGVPVDLSKVNEAGEAIAGASLSLYRVNGSTESFITSFTSTTSPQYLELCPGTYKLVETNAPKGYYVSQPITFTVEKKPYETQLFRMTDKAIKIGINKIGDTSSEPVVGAHLTVTDQKNNMIYEFDTTGGLVEIPSNILEAGKKYFINETYNPPGYFALSQEVMIEVPLYAPAESELTDGVKGYNVLDEEIDYRVTKVDADTREQIKGATMQVIDSNKNVIDEWVTDGSEHRIPKEKLTVGKMYSIHEAKAPAGYYTMAKDITFTVTSTARGTNTLIAEDRAISILVTKTNESEAALAGATLVVYDSQHNELDRWVSGNDSHKLKNLSDGEKYYIEELASATGYYPTTSSKEFTVEAKSVQAQEKSTNISFINHEIQLYVRKQNSKTKEYMAGATLEVIDDETNEVVDTIVTETEKVQIKNLKAGKSYTVHESDSVDGFYYPDSDVHFTVPATWEEASKMDDSEFIITVQDAPINFNIIKRDASTQEYVGGALLAIYANQDDTEPLYTWTTNAEEPEKISDKIQLKAGKTYYIKELDTATGYYLNSAIQEVTIPVQNPGRTLTADFYNIPIKWNIKKTDMDGNTLTTSEDGTYFTLEVYDTNGSEDSIDDDTLITTLETNDKDYKKKGYFDMQTYIDQGLIKGGDKYRIHEASAANGYRLAQDVIVTIENSGETDTILSTVKDEEISVGIMKVNENGDLLTQVSAIVDGKAKQVGFELTIYDEETGEEVLSFNTKDEDYAKKGYKDVSKYLSAAKSYVVKETSLPKGYYQAKDYSFTVDSLEYTEVNGKTIGIIKMVDPTIKAQFRKENQYGDVVFGTYGEGFKFQILDTNGTDDTSDDYVVGTIDTYTDSHNDGGWIEIGQYLQEARTYRIHEYYAPVGYELSSTDAYVTTPSYYAEEKDGTVINVVLSQ